MVNIAGIKCLLVWDFNLKATRREKTQRMKLNCSRVFVRYIQLFRERLFAKHVHVTIPKGNMGYDQYSVPDTVAVEPTFVAFL